MPTYVTLLRCTQRGIESVKEGPARLDAAKKLFEAAGGRFIGFYLTMGQYDAVAISEFPADEAIAKGALAGSAGQNGARCRVGRVSTQAAPDSNW
jgi:uncharacterized protein with GYD domain